MLSTQRNRNNSKILFENAIEIFHLVLAIVPAISIVIVAIITICLKNYLGHSIPEHLNLWIELIFILAAIIANIIILKRRSRDEENKELTLFWTFLTNNLAPIESGEYQKYNVQIAVIEEEEKAFFRNDLKTQFGKEINIKKLKDLISKIPKYKSTNLDNTKLENLILDKVSDPQLYFKPVYVPKAESTSGKSVEEIRLEKLEAFKNNLTLELGKATAVVVVRTEELENKSWAHEAINSWAHDNSEIAILSAINHDEFFLNAESKKDFRDEIAEKFLKILKDARSLPWRLLQRTKDRGSAWRIQAEYNRLMAWNLFYILVMCFLMAAIYLTINIEASDKNIE